MSTIHSLSKSESCVRNSPKRRSCVVQEEGNRDCIIEGSSLMKIWHGAYPWGSDKDGTHAFSLKASSRPSGICLYELHNSFNFFHDSHGFSLRRICLILSERISFSLIILSFVFFCFGYIRVLLTIDKNIVMTKIFFFF